MREYEEFINVINTLKVLSPIITDAQRIGLLRQGVQEYGLTTDEADDILKSSGLIVGVQDSFFDVLGISVEELENLSEADIVAHIESIHDRLYRTSLNAGGRPRSDGRSEVEWRNLLNQAKDTITDPLKRSEYISILQQEKIQDLRAEPSQELDSSDANTNIPHALSSTFVPDGIDVPDDMVYIPAGEFQMGSEHVDAEEDEQPIHTVFVNAFLMDKYPVTNRKFREFLNTNPEWQKPESNFTHISSNLHDGLYLKDWQMNMYPPGEGDHPVTQVSWYAAMAYAESVSKRLPTEAEWERAARGGLDGKNYPWGNVEDSDNIDKYLDGEDTLPIGLIPANHYGLYDMCGNVWEWCLDAYNVDFYNDAPQNNPFYGPNSIEWVVDNYRQITFERVLRGGPWGFDALGARVSQRLKSNPTDTLSTYSFRCVKYI
ncbi:hypothetical protein C6497_06425 [Candidatus Poribacteria bacterium]|nr:MAG: hypothetical protein C6497_06425 [Candidatus Poribacteria bacterium]